MSRLGNQVGQEPSSGLIEWRGPLDPGKYPDEDYGVFCTARRDKRTIELPLADVEVDEDRPGLQVIDDYSFWIWIWR